MEALGTNYVAYQVAAYGENTPVQSFIIPNRFFTIFSKKDDFFFCYFLSYSLLLFLSPCYSCCLFSLTSQVWSKFQMRSKSCNIIQLYGSAAVTMQLGLPQTGAAKLRDGLLDSDHKDHQSIAQGLRILLYCYVHINM